MMHDLFPASQQLAVIHFRARPITQLHCEVAIKQNVIATMTGSLWKHVGNVTVGGKTYPISSGVMKVDGSKSVSYEIVERFVQPTLVEICDSRSGQVYTLRQKRIWSRNLVLLRGKVVQSEFNAPFFDTKQHVNIQQPTQQSVILLSIWLNAINLAFCA